MDDRTTPREPKSFTEMQTLTSYLGRNFGDCYSGKSNKSSIVSTPDIVCEDQGVIWGLHPVSLRTLTINIIYTEAYFYKTPKNHCRLSENLRLTGDRSRLETLSSLCSGTQEKEPVQWRLNSRWKRVKTQILERHGTTVLSTSTSNNLQVYHTIEFVHGTQDSNEKERGK